MIKHVLFAVFVMPLVSSASPVACPVGTALDYVALGSSGCIDDKGALLSNFSFSTNPGFPVPLGSIEVSPTESDVNSVFPPYFRYASGLTLTFSPPFNPAPQQEIDLEIGLAVRHTTVGQSVGYVIVPTFPPDINFLAFQNGTVTVTAGGMPEVFEADSTGGAVLNQCSICSPTVEIQYDFPIWAGKPGTQGFTKFEVAVSDVPEANTYLLSLSGIALLILFRCKTVSSSYKPSSATATTSPTFFTEPGVDCQKEPCATS
jgi:hypothetical protein